MTRVAANVPGLQTFIDEVGLVVSSTDDDVHAVAAADVAPRSPRGGS